MKDLVTIETGREKDFMLAIKDCYTYDARHFVGFLDGRELDTRILAEYVDSMKGEGIPARTIIKRLQAAKKRIRQLFEQSPESMDIGRRWKMEEYLKTVKAPKIQSKAIGKDKIISPRECRELIQGASPSIALIIEFLFLTGARVSEAI